MPFHRHFSKAARAHHLALHAQALELFKSYREAESALARTIREIGQTKAYMSFGQPSLFQYCVRELGMTHSVAGCFIFVSRHAARVPALAAAVESGALPVSKASRIAKAVSSENAEKLIAFAQTHPQTEIDREVARLKPDAKKRDQIRFIGDDLVEVRATISAQKHEQLKRAQDLLAQRGLPCGIGEAIEAAIEALLDKHDPVRKTERAETRKRKRCARADALVSFEVKSSSSELAGDCRSHDPADAAAKADPSSTLASDARLQHCFNKIRSNLNKRVPLASSQKREVLSRDGHRCTHEDARGHRCENRRYLHVHHIVPVSRGGTSDLRNLTTLCSGCHELVHQLEFPIHGAVSWVRARSQPYLTFSQGKSG